MADRYFNPFQAIDINVPVDLHEAFSRYCQTGGNADIDQSPFPRMVDLWFLAVCVGARMNLDPVDIGKYETKKIIDGSIFGSDPWRVHTLMLIAVGKSGDVQIVSEPRKMMAIASGLAIAGLPKVIEMLKDGEADPIWNLSDCVETILREKAAQAA
jgi:hypothetical protein